MGEHGVDICSVLRKELTFLDCEPFDSKDQLFEYMTKQFEAAGVVSDQKAFKKALEERESQGPTYMGDFIAIPHGQCEAILEPAVGFVRCRESFNYESSGEQGQVKYIFVLAVSNAQKGNQHLRILATLAGYLMKDEFRDLMETVKSYEEMVQGIHLIAEQE